MIYNKIKTADDAIEYLKETVDAKEFYFDGYEEIPYSMRLRDPLERFYYSPRYNAQTVKFVEQLGGVDNAKRILLNSLNHIEGFKISLSNDMVDSVVLVGRIGNEKVYMKVMNPNRKTVVIMHPYTHVENPS